MYSYCQDKPVDDKVARYFGYVIAFLAPGFLGLWAVSYYSVAVATWLGRANAASTSVGDFLLVVVASLGVGVFLSGVRYFAFEKVLFKTLKFLKVDDRGPDNDEARLDPTVREELREQYYRYYQFYANTAVALVLAYAGWSHKGRTETVSVWVVLLVFVLAEAVLIASARDCLNKFRRRKAAFLRSVPSSTQDSNKGSNDDERRRHSEEHQVGASQASQASTVETSAAASATTKASDPEKGLTKDSKR